MNTLRQAAQAAEDFLDRRWRKTGACDDDIREHAEALRAALAEPQPELAEFVLVPREPTPEMVGAMAVEESTGTINGISTLGMAGACLAWESALAAAPKAQQPRPEPVAWTGDPSTQDYTSTQPEPVAEVYDTFGNTQDPTKCSGHVWLAPGYFPPRGTKLYAAPQAQQHDCERRPYGDLRNAKWLDPECYAKGACQSLIFKQAQQPQPERVRQDHRRGCPLDQRRVMANNTKRQVIDEPPGFSEAWDRLTSGRIGAYGGKKQAYAEFYRAGQQSRDGWIEPKPVVPRPTKGSLDAWPFAIKHDHEPQPTGHIPETP